MEVDECVKKVLDKILEMGGAAFCVTKGNTELLDAINSVLAGLGEAGINALVAKHLGIN